jgi:hypothetical protein
MKEQENRFLNMLSEKAEECKKMEIDLAEKEKELQKATANINSLEEACRDKIVLQAGIEDLRQQLNVEHASKVYREARLEEALAQAQRNDALIAARTELDRKSRQLEDLKADRQKIQDDLQTIRSRNTLAEKLYELRHAHERWGTVSEKLRRSNKHKHETRESLKTWVQDLGSIPLVPQKVDDIDEGRLREINQYLGRAHEFKKRVCDMLDGGESNVSVAPDSSKSNAALDNGGDEALAPSSPLSDPPEIDEDDINSRLRVTFDCPTSSEYELSEDELPEDGLPEDELPQASAIFEERKSTREDTPVSILRVRKSRESITSEQGQHSNGAAEEHESRPDGSGTRCRGRPRGRGGRIKATTTRNAKTPVRDRYSTPVRGKSVASDENGGDRSGHDELADSVIGEFNEYQQTASTTRKRTRSQSAGAEDSKKSKLFGKLQLTETRDDDAVGNSQHTSPHFQGSELDSAPKTSQAQASNSKIKRTYSKAVTE